MEPSSPHQDNDPPRLTLLPFQDEETPVPQNASSQRLPGAFHAYLKLVDATGREIRDGKRGAISANLAPILERLGIDSGEWVNSVAHFGRRFRQVAGSLDKIINWCEQRGRRWQQGMRSAGVMYLR